MNKKVEKPKLRHMATLGSLGGYGNKNGEWSVEQKIQVIKKAGFDGFVGRLPLVTKEHVETSGLLFAATVDIQVISEIRGKLKAVQKAGARCVNVQMLNHDTTTKRAVEVARRVIATADDLEMDVAIEVHRDTCTETPEKAYALAEGFEKAEKKPLKMTWDFSHPAVVKHLAPPYWDRLAERPVLIQHTHQFNIRPFYGHHAQIPALGRGGKLTPEFLDWLDFAERVMACWLETAKPGQEMFSCPEQIGGGYYLSVFGDRWKDVLAVRDGLERVWRKQVRKWKA